LQQTKEALAVIRDKKLSRMEKVEFSLFVTGALILAFGDLMQFWPR
jgi:hypothetical protein